ncbi:hypothetical protein [uncultured Clostridium sp.]|uniref:hypothetical protein n=1 Tax=uncultured Clostridium sp. TaxID=59620 RepID=UPI00272F5E6D|nr:hypothetical protein [uncultured Clostridium sp.]
MGNRLKKDFMLTEKSFNYLMEVKEKNHMKYNSDALEFIIREHQNNSNITTDVMIKLIGKEIAEQLKSELLGIKKASNETDKNSQVIIELLNGFFVKSGYNFLATTEEVKCEAIDNAIDVVEKRIATQRVSKLDREY